MGVQEFDDVVVAEDDFRVEGEFIFSLVLDEHGNEVKQSDWRLLVLIDLGILDGDELVADVLLHEEHALSFEDMSNHSVIVSLQEVQQIQSGEVEVWVTRDGHLELAVL